MQTLIIVWGCREGGGGGGWGRGVRDKELTFSLHRKKKFGGSGTHIGNFHAFRNCLNSLENNLSVH